MFSVKNIDKEQKLSGNEINHKFVDGEKNKCKWATKIQYNHQSTDGVIEIIHFKLRLQIYREEDGKESVSTKFRISRLALESPNKSRTNLIRTKELMYQHVAESLQW